MICKRRLCELVVYTYEIVAKLNVLFLGGIKGGGDVSFKSTGGGVGLFNETVAPSLPPPGPIPVAAPNPFAIERPHAAPHMLERQGSFRGFSHLNNKYTKFICQCTK